MPPEDRPPFVMPYGTYRGSPLDQVPIDYLKGVILTATRLNEITRAEITKFLAAKELEHAAS